MYDIALSDINLNANVKCVYTTFGHELDNDSNTFYKYIYNNNTYIDNGLVRRKRPNYKNKIELN